MGRKRADNPEVIKLYQEGLSTRQIGKLLTVSSSRVHVIIKRNGLSRNKSTAAIIRKPAISKHWRSSRAQARKIWERTKGAIPSGHHIHHKDGDYTNNDISNLECITAGKHMHIHHAGPEFNIPRHLRPARQAYMREYLKEYNATKTT